MFNPKNFIYNYFLKFVNLFKFYYIYKKCTSCLLRLENGKNEVVIDFRGNRGEVVKVRTGRQGPPLVIGP